MSENEWEWDESSNSPPPTPGKNLRSEPGTKGLLSRTEDSNNYKRRLDLGEIPSFNQFKKAKLAQGESATTDYRPVNNDQRESECEESSQQEPIVSGKNKQSVPIHDDKPQLSQQQQRRTSSEEHQQPEVRLQNSDLVRQELEGEKMTSAINDKPISEPQRKRRPAGHKKKDEPKEEQDISQRESKRLKVCAWAKILKFKKKLYIPWTSDPRSDQQEEEVAPTHLEDKENCQNGINILDRTPMKIDHEDILRNISLYRIPKLLSPLYDVPGY